MESDAVVPVAIGAQGYDRGKTAVQQPRRGQAVYLERLLFRPLVPIEPRL